MDRIDSIIAPQWVDFTESLSPQIPMKDYFEKEHAIHGHINKLCDLPTENAENAENVPTNILNMNKEAQQDLDIIKSTPVKIISLKHRKKMTGIKELTTYDQVLNDAMKKLELCKKPLKARVALNKTIQESDTFKTPTITKSSKSVGYRSVPNKSVQSSIARRSVRVGKDVCTPEKSDDVIVCKTKALTNILFKGDKADTKIAIYKKTEVIQVDGYENEEEVKEEHTEEHEEEDEGENKVALHDKSEELMENSDNKEEQNDTVMINAMIEKRDRAQSHKRRTSILTWQNGRRSLNKRRGSNRFVSLAEAVSRFQNDTPKRFRTICNKNSTVMSQNSSLKPSIHQRLKMTIPVSPALMSKNRTRAVTVLSQEEREKREMEKMKKHPIKANPIPRRVLQGPARPVSKTAKKLSATTVTSDPSSASVSQQLEKTVTRKNVSTQLKNPGTSHHDKTSSAKNTVTKVLVTDPTGIIVECEEILFFGVPKDNGPAKSVTRIVPFSFEARNKNLQMKKEQRLKSLQEANKVKMEFHARPVPNFSKPPLTRPPPVVKQQKEKKTMVQQCPFSFEERDKNWSKKREELVKQMMEEDKRMRVFHASPAPIFKPVMVRGVSKERLSMKEVVKAEKKQVPVDDQENEESNIVSIEKTQENKCAQKTKKIACITVDKQNAKDKGRENNTINATLSLKLNTNKRARERREFDERLKRKEMEEEAKRQEEKRRQEENEKQMRAEQRKLAEVKARPMPTYKPLVIAKATKPLTNPQSPAFSNKRKPKQP